MKLCSATGAIEPTPPFDFEKTLDFLGGFDAVRDEQTLAPGGLTKTLSIHAQPIVCRLASRGTPDVPCLHYALYSAQSIHTNSRAAALDRIRFFLSADDDLRPFYDLAREDLPFAGVVQGLYGLHQVKFLTPFENAIWAVLAQRTPIPVARSLKRALVEQFGCFLDVNGTRYWAFPEPAQLARASLRELNRLLKHGRKAEYVRAVIDAFEKVDEGFLRHGDYDAVRAWLLGIKGIGAWSADFVLLRGLGRMQQLHIARESLFEKRMSDAVSKVYANGKRLSGKEILNLAERYGKWQGYWAYYLRMAV